MSRLITTFHYEHWITALGRQFFGVWQIVNKLNRTLHRERHVEGGRLERHSMALADLAGLLHPWSLPECCRRPLSYVDWGYLCIGCFDELVLMVSPPDTIKLCLHSLQATWKWTCHTGCAVVILWVLTRFNSAIFWMNELKEICPLSWLCGGFFCFS